MSDRAHYAQLAAVFDYPDSGYLIRIADTMRTLGDRFPSARAELESFAERLPALDTTLDEPTCDQLQEIFTRSFDVQSITTLSVGYIMFGDDYKRGELLVNLSRECDEVGIDCGTELPDHLPNVLRLMALWRDDALVREFVEEILHPAIARMIAEFGTRRMEERNALYRKHFKTLIASSPDRGTIFRHPLAALAAVLEQDFDLGPHTASEPISDFLGSIGRELDIEHQEGRPVQSGSVQ